LDNVMLRTAARWAVSIAALATMVLMLVVFAPRAHAQTTTTTEPTIPTSEPSGETASEGGPLLVPGASDAPATKADEVKNDDNTGTVVALVITGLLVVALLLGLLTYWYWRNTRPTGPVTAAGE
jgi:hypothetical protein